MGTEILFVFMSFQESQVLFSTFRTRVCSEAETSRSRLQMGTAFSSDSYKQTHKAYRRVILQKSWHSWLWAARGSLTKTMRVTVQLTVLGLFICRLISIHTNNPVTEVLSLNAGSGPGSCSDLPTVTHKSVGNNEVQFERHSTISLSLSKL